MKQLIETEPVKQMDLFKQKLEQLREAGITGREAYKAALEISGAHFRRRNGNYSPRNQLTWHFQIDLKGQQYLFKED